MAPSDTQSSEPGLLSEMAGLAFVAFVVLVVLGVLGGAGYGVFAWVDANFGWSAPDTFAGDVPQTEHPLQMTYATDPADGPPFVKNHLENNLGWRVTAARPVNTDIETLDGEPRPYTVHRMSGFLSITNTDECPGARVAWTLSPLQGPPFAPAPLSVDAPDSDSVSEYALPDAGTTDVRVTLQRLDTAPCEAFVEWYDASLK